MVYQRIYDNSPIIFQNIMATLYGYMVGRYRYGKHYHEHISFLKAFEHLTRKEQESFQFNALIKFLRFTVNNSAFYRELYSNIDISSFSSIEDIKKLPMVTKEQLRQNIDRAITIDKRHAQVSHTGGTTGKSLHR
jgi:phenylacetate-CoA ligase